MIISILINRILTAITTGLDLQDWATILVILGLFAVICLPIGFRTGCLYRTPTPQNMDNLLISMITVFFIPVLAEELLFRVILLPHPFIENVSVLHWIIIAIIILIFFILYHPFLAKTVYRSGDPLFFNPIFLTLAGFLGLACTAAYWFTGSLWGVVIIHWVIDWVWLYRLGGRAKFSSP